MSFIGPRPHLPGEVNQYSEKQRQVLTIKPGITGMAQVYGRDTNSFDREIELDLFYIENWSLL
jgi:lipopolysaccharide/colanic/teichoic acid biosynthesis glycosyltransferase